MSFFIMYDASRCSYCIVLMYFHKDSTESATIMVSLLMAKEFGICTVVSVNGHLLKIKSRDSRVNVNILFSTSVQFTPTTVQVPNLIIL